jgi:guanylate kinase
MGEYEMDGESCLFVSHDKMKEGLAANEFLDVGEHDNYLFGTTFQSVRDVISKENKLCIIDCRPEVIC